MVSQVLCALYLNLLRDMQSLPFCRHRLYFPSLDSYNTIHICFPASCPVLLFRPISDPVSKLQASLVPVPLAVRMRAS